jgi:hypothetical protein
VRTLSTAIKCPRCGTAIHLASTALILEAVPRGSYRLNTLGGVERVKTGAGTHQLHVCQAAS